MGRLLKYSIITYSILIVLVLLSIIYPPTILIVIYGFPIFAVFMGAFYLSKEKKGYINSLFIPITYIFLGFLIDIIFFKYFITGEELLFGLLTLIPMLAITFVASLILNAIVLTIVKKKK